MANGAPTSRREVLRDAGITIVLLAVIITCATIVLSATEFIVDRTGVGGSLIGVITLGLASALPELTTALAGIKHKEAGISLGTLVGSNITNPLLAIGGGALISRYAVPRPLITWDLPWETLTGICFGRYYGSTTASWAEIGHLSDRDLFCLHLFPYFCLQRGLLGFV